MSHCSSRNTKRILSVGKMIVSRWNILSLALYSLLFTLCSDWNSLMMKWWCKHYQRQSVPLATRYGSIDVRIGAVLPTLVPPVYYLGTVPISMMRDWDMGIGTGWSQERCGRA